MGRFELVPIERVQTEAEVVCVRREGAYLRLADWCPRTLVLMSEADYPVRPTGGRSLPSMGVVYVVEAQLPPRPVSILDFRLRHLGEMTTGGPLPLPPPAGLPGPGEQMPIHSENGMRRLIQSAIHESLSKESLDALAYLVRRAHGVGCLAGRKRPSETNSDE